MSSERKRESCDHQKLGGAAPHFCAHPGCVNSFGGDSLVTMEALPEVGSIVDFMKVYVGPDGVPIHGLPGCIRRIYPRVLDGDGWRFGEPTVEVHPVVSAEERCRAAWEQHGQRAMGTDE
jgi:hypothetical protein